MMYTTYAAMASGIHRPLLKEFFESEIPEELEHAKFLANKITALGGLPSAKPAPVKLVEGNRAMLEAVLKAEEETIARYVQRRNQAEPSATTGW
nr:ferritin-like domain-containing protein [Rhodothermus marinus]